MKEWFFFSFSFLNYNKINYNAFLNIFFFIQRDFPIPDSASGVRFVYPNRVFGNPYQTSPFREPCLNPPEFDHPSPLFSQSQQPLPNPIPPAISPPLQFSILRLLCLSLNSSGSMMIAMKRDSLNKKILNSFFFFFQIKQKMF